MLTDVNKTATCRRCHQTCEAVEGADDVACPGCWQSLCKTARNNNKRARKHGAMGRLTGDDWFQVLVSHNFSCAACGRAHGAGKHALTLDHKYPMSRGGMNSVENIQPLCKECHALKDGDPDVSPWNEVKVRRDRKLRLRSQQFMNQLRNQLVREHYANEVRQQGWHRTVAQFFLDMEMRHHAAIADGYDESFGKFMIETLLDYYMEKKNDLPQS